MDNVLIRLAALSIQKSLMIGLLLTGFWYFALFDDGSILQGRIGRAQAELTTEQAKEKESDRALKEISTLQEAIANLADQFKSVSERIPTNIQMSEIIRTVDKVSDATGLSLKSKEPKKSSKQDLIEVLPLTVTAEGSFAEITSFFYYISTLERVVRVRGFKMVGPTDLKKNRTIQMSGEIVSYKFIPNADEKSEANAPRRTQ